MVSPQPIDTVNVSHASSSSKAVREGVLVAPSPTLERETSKSLMFHPNTIMNTNHINSHHHPTNSSSAAVTAFGVPSRRLRRAPSFIYNNEQDQAQPYLWSLDEEWPHVKQQASQQSQQQSQPQQQEQVSMSLDSPIYTHLDLQLTDPSMVLPMTYDFGGADLTNYTTAFASQQPSECERCWAQDAPCAECAHLAEKQSQFDTAGWPIDVPMYDDAFTPSLKQQPSYHMDEDASWVKSMPMKQEFIQQQPIQQQSIFEEDYEEKTPLPTQSQPASFLPISTHPSLLPLSAPLLVCESHSCARVPGKLTHFLPQGQDMMAIDPSSINPNYHTVVEEQYQHDEVLPSSANRQRALRARKVRSRSPSPDLTDRSESPTSMAESAYETDSYEAEDDVQSTPRSRAQVVKQIQNQPLDDAISPPAVRYGTMLDSSSGDTSSSSEPPALNSLLPVAARDLLPSRPSTAAIPPAHIKDRLVKSAKKLLTAADGVNENVQVQVIPIFYPSKGAPGAHKIRLIRVQNTNDGSVSVYAHAADVGGVVERKSNISRLFGKFESPSEKLLMNVVGAHNHTVGQESNILTFKGVKKFLQTNKMKEEHAYRNWITNILLPRLVHDPLVISEEMVEIEASTDPRMPHQIKPKALKRLEKKRERKLAEEKQQTVIVPVSPSAAATVSPASKRAKYTHSPPPMSLAQPIPSQLLSPAAMAMASHQTPFRMVSPPSFNLGATSSMSHAA